MNLKNWKGIYE